MCRGGIGCDEDHIFCKDCLTEYFKIKRNKRCPSCNQGKMDKSSMRSAKFTERIVMGLKVKCELALQQTSEGKESSPDDNIKTCQWIGQLNELSTHINQQCPLFVMICQYCQKPKKRYEMEEHLQKCDMKLIPCQLQCGSVLF